MRFRRCLCPEIGARFRFMKGCIELCCDTRFTYSTQKGKSADIGQITRPKPQDCYNCCRMICTQVDFYTVEYVTPFSLPFLNFVWAW